MTEPRTDAEIAAELDAMFGEPVKGRDYIEMPSTEVTPRSLEENQAIEAAEPDPRGDLFLALVAKACPGISRIQALSNGAHYRASIGMTDGWAADDYTAWCDSLRGYALVVNLDDPDGDYALLTQAAAAEYIAANPNICIVAAWGVNGS